MPTSPLPGPVKKAIDYLSQNLARQWTLHDLGELCDCAPRTLQTNFGRFVGTTPMAFLRRARLEEARRRLLSAACGIRVADVAGECGFVHLGRFSALYRNHYGEVPSETLERASLEINVSRTAPPRRLARISIAVVPFKLIGPRAHEAAGLEQEIIAQLCRLTWTVPTSSRRARYQLHGKIQSGLDDRLRVTALLFDAAQGCYLFADTSEGSFDALFSFQERFVARLVSKLWSPIVDAEGSMVTQREAMSHEAWKLTMFALKGVLSVEPKSLAAALEHAERAIELAADEALPLSVAAWCHAVRASHHQTSQPAKERAAAQNLAQRAAALNTGDATTEAMLAAAFTLAHDLDSATIHAARALQFDRGSAWAWGRSAWIQAYRGNSAEAIERFQIARALSPGDLLTYQWSLGIASAHFEAGRYERTVQWSRRALSEQPKAATIHRLLAPAAALSGNHDQSRQSIATLQRQFSDMTISHIVSALPLTASHLARRAEGLEQAGLQW